MVRNENFWKMAILVVSAIVLVVIYIFIEDYSWKAIDGSVPAYTSVEEDAKVVKITGKANVRKDPMIREISNYTNSFGLIKEENFTIEVSKVKRLKQHLDGNGEYIGLAVEDILATKEGKDWFPESIKDDPDGIVWVNYKYIVVLA